MAKLENKDELGTVMYNLLESLRIVALLIKPFLPETGSKIWDQLGLEDLEENSLADTTWGLLVPGTKTRKGDPIFPRIEVEREADEPAKTEPKKEEAKAEAKAAPAPSEPEGVLIGIEDFMKCELVVAEILEAVPVKGADRLLKLQVDIGTERRQIVAGIAQHYQPDQLIGKRVIVVKNLKPAKLRGELSQGMLLAATTPEGRVEVVSVSDGVPAGSKVK